MAHRMTFPAKIAVGVGPPLVGIILITVAAGLSRRAPEGRAAARERRGAAEQVHVQGVENAFRLSPRLYSGGEPRGEAAFTDLKALGVKTIVTVDGARPDVETARKLGIRTVHLPIGYDGVPREQAVRIVAAVTALPGPVFVHCHHGKHRGPAAVAICGIATEGWTKTQALAWMEQAGTSPDYPGLYNSVREFVPPSTEDLQRASADLPERAEVADLVAVMVQVDARWDRLKAAQKAGFKASVGQPAIDPAHEALQLAEHFREASRLAEVRAGGGDLARKMEAAAQRAAVLQEALRGHNGTPSADSRKDLEAAFAAVAKSCTGCHARHRDRD